MEKLYDLYLKKLQTVSTDFVRYLYERINWDSQLIVIMGARGVGKTTMVLQHIIMTDAKNESLYISADNTYFAGEFIDKITQEKLWDKS